LYFAYALFGNSGTTTSPQLGCIASTTAGAIALDYLNTGRSFGSSNNVAAAPATTQLLNFGNNGTTYPWWVALW
jgi:hypothetical protein